jgi:YVTN family beta-propeller protein
MTVIDRIRWARGSWRSSRTDWSWRAVGGRLALGLTLVAAATVATIPLATSAGASGPTITAVTFSGTPAAPSVTYWGSGFGTESDLGAESPAGCGYSGSDYGTNIGFSDNGWTAGNGSGGGGDCIGVIISSYSDSQITFTLGSGYILAGIYDPVENGDAYSASLLGASFSGTVHYPSTSTDNGPFAYVTDASAGTVNVVDSSTQTTVGSPITVGSNPESVVVTPDGTDVFVANSGSGTVSEIATSTNMLVATITLSSVTRLALAPGGATLYAIAGGKLYPIDLTTDTVGSSIAGVSGGGNLAITPDGTKAFVSTGNTVVPVDLVHGTAGSAINTGLFTGPFQLEMSPTGTTVYVDGFGSPPYQTVIPISVASDTTGSPIYTCHDDAGGQFALSPDGSTLWVACNGSGSIEEYDLNTSTVVGTDSLGEGASDDTAGITVAPDGGTVYTVDTTAQNVVPFDVASLVPDIPIAASTSSGSDTLALTPDLGPSAALSATTSGMTTSFDASSSVPDTSPIVSYSWNFGDSDTDVTTTSSVSHTYATNGNYTASVTETDAAGASTTEDYTGQTASLDGSANAEASASVEIATSDCDNESTCDAEVVSPATTNSPQQTVTVDEAAPGSPSQTLSVTSGPGDLGCKGKHFMAMDGVTSYDSTYTPTGNVTVTDVLAGVHSVRGIQICFEGPTPPPSYLKKCKRTPVAPCETLSTVAGGVQATILVPAGDPRFRIDGVENLVENPTSVSSKGVIGKTITIKGSELLGLQGGSEPAVAFTSVGGSTLPGKNASYSASKIVVDVPSGAATGPISVAWPDETVVSDGSVKIT